MPEFSSPMACFKDVCLRLIDIHRKTFKAGNSAKECQLNRVLPLKVKGNSHRHSKKTNGKKREA